MSPLLEDLLAHDFPALFQDEPAHCICADGWESLIRSACTALSRVNDRYGDIVAIPIIKAWNGMLWIHVEEHNPERPRAVGPEVWIQIQAIIVQARDASLTVCEDCGRPGRLAATAEAWYRVVCEEHRHRQAAIGGDYHWLPPDHFQAG